MYPTKGTASPFFIFINHPLTTEETSRSNPTREYGQMPEEKGTTAAEKEEKDTPPAGSQGLSEKGETTPPEKPKNKSDQGPDEEVLTLKGFTKRDDGKYEFRIDPDDENSTVYVGDSPDAIIAEIQKGMKEKDAVIRKGKIKDNLNVDRRRKNAREEDEADQPKAQLPNESEITRRLYKQALDDSGIDPEMVKNLNNRDWWKKLKEDNDLEPEEVLEKKQAIKEMIARTNQLIDSELREQNALYRNDQILMKVSDTVATMLEDARIPESSVGEGKAFDFDAILDKFMKSLGKDGILDSGDIIAEAQRAIRKIERESNKSDLQKKLEADAARAKKERDNTHGQGGTGEQRNKPTVVALDYRSATRDFLKEQNITD